MSRPLTPYEIAEMARKYGIQTQGKTYTQVEQEVTQKSQESAQQKTIEYAPAAITVIEERVKSGQTTLTAGQQHVLDTYARLGKPVPQSLREKYGLAAPTPAPAPTPYQVAEIAQKEGIITQGKNYATVEQQVIQVSQIGAETKKQQTASQAIDVMVGRVTTGKTTPQAAYDFISKEAPTYIDSTIQKKAVMAIDALESGKISYEPPANLPTKEPAVTNPMLTTSPFTTPIQQKTQEYNSVTAFLRPFAQQTGEFFEGIPDAIKMVSPVSYLMPFQADVAVGFVKGGESLINPNVKSFWDVISLDPKSREAYFEDVKGREGEFFGEVLFDVALSKGLGAAGKVVGLSRKALIAGAALNVGISQGISYGVTGQPLDAKISRSLAYAGAGEAILGTAALGMIAKSGATGAKVASNLFGRAGVNAAIDAGIEGVASKGDIQRIASGAAFGATFSIGGDVTSMGISELRAKLPRWLGGVERLELGETTTGKIGQELDTYVSTEGIEELGGKKLRVVPDVSEKVVGFEGVTTESIVGEYTGKHIATAHATLSTTEFDLEVGGKTLLEGIPSESAGFRKAKELYPFYSAPSGPDDVTIYGGYAGIGEGISDQPVKIKFGGKATALVTLDTEVSPNFLKQFGESADEYLDRVTRLAGKTGVSPETVLGLSPERQVSTTTSYLRGGEQLVGTQFVSEGKIGTFQIKQTGKGLLSLPKYTNVEVVVGKFEAPDINLPSKSINLVDYGGSYGKTIISSPPTIIIPPKISVPKFPTSTTKTTQPQTMESINKKLDAVNEVISKSFSSDKTSVPSIEPVSLPSMVSKSSLPNVISKSAIPSVPSYKPPSFPSYRLPTSLPSEYSQVISSASLPSSPSEASIPSIPSYPKTSIPSHPREPSIPSFPSEASIPNYPSTLSYPKESKTVASLPSYKSPSFYPIKPTFTPRMFSEAKRKPIRKSETSMFDLTKQKLKYPIATPQSILKGIKNPFKTSKTHRKPHTTSKRRKK